MNALETNASNAIVNYLSHEDSLGKIPPRLWDAKEPATIPRLSIRVNQGAEIVYRYGVYRMTCEMKLVTEVRGDSGIDTYTEAIRRLLIDNQEAHTKLTDAHFFCFAVESLSSSGNTIASKKRSRIITVNLVGFDLDRFN